MKYEKALRGLKGEFGTLMEKYLQKLHNAFHKDNGLNLSHNNFVDKVRQDCMSIFSNNLGRIALDERSEEEVTKEILEHNYDQEDIQYMKEIENIDLYSHLHTLERNCLKRSDTGWVTFGIHELIQNGKIDQASLGSKRTQFCKFCGEAVHISSGTETGLRHQDKSLICSSDARQEGIIDFEFSLPWEDVHRYMGLKFKADGIYARVWFNGRIKIQPGKVVAASVGSLSDNKQ
jgi:hypothetical protein